MEVQVALGERSYHIMIQPGLLQDAQALAQQLPHREIVLITNDTIKQHYAAIFEHAFADRVFCYISIPDGEQYKTIDTWQQVLTQLIEQRYSRHVALIALGGGVVGDLTGFVAASYQRGVDYIQVPTTLLAQVDSSVGGKTAVNHELGKNLIGAFHQPKCVLIDPDTLHTLPKREYIAGLAEVFKYGLICDAAFFAWLCEHRKALCERDTEAVMFAIARSCALKADVVAQDEKESGLRAILNFGHTFGHAIEAVTQYQRFLHGEAVAIGMVIAARLSQHMDLLTKQEVQTIETWLHEVGLPTAIPTDLSESELIEAMQGDKKRTEKGLKFIILPHIGKADIISHVEKKLLLTIKSGYNYRRICKWF